MKSAGALPVVMLVPVVFAGEAPLAPRSYSTTVTKLEARTDGVVGASYAAGNLWLGLRGGELWHFDAGGKVTKYVLPVKGAEIRGLWAKGPSVAAFVGPELVSVSDTGLIRTLYEVPRPFHMAVPLRDGYVGLEGRGEVRLVYVRSNGVRQQLLPRVRDSAKDAGKGEGGEAVETDAKTEPEGKEEAAEAAEEGPREDSQASQPSSREPNVVPDGGKLSALDEDRVAYVTPDPYQAWIVGLDGSVRWLSVEDSEVIRPEDSAFVRRPDRKFEKVQFSHIGRIEWHEGQLVVERGHFVSFAVVGKVPGLPEGAPAGGRVSFIDFIDPETGKVRERVDLAAIRPRGKWAGFRGDALVLVGYSGGGYSGGPEGPYVAFASAD